MEIKLHVARTRPGKPRHPTAGGWRAGLPVKRFFTRFRSMADLPPEDLDILSEHIRLALDVTQEPGLAALHAAVRAELNNREASSSND
ncbi:hypothetical protein PY310_08505 [Pseudarthrobacter sp. H3Y2-7]|jgi:hypothetical protein|uniref:hypothetical protein n=1 Tax=Pseudarthrobacter naphthalenicus TaxID=3031328 RepID=UPI0023B1358A|nr:hypothetical protein [Pseudarthrobacter sp. H3Y2-7]MDE8668621.1 hypothetical protein [Pseudarthrobacter sp. H3Y2-7]